MAVTIAVVLFALIAGVVAGSRLLPSNASSPKAQAAKLIAQVGKIAVLPANETPAIATVTDNTKVSEAFLRQAKNGDKLLLYYQAKKVYLYRPSSNKLVDIGPITVDPSAAEVNGTRIAIWNGAADSSKAAGLRSTVAQAYPKAVTALSIAQAKRSDYPTTIVIDLTNADKYNFVTQLAALTGAQRGVLPMGESAPADTDVLIIVGKN